MLRSIIIGAELISVCIPTYNDCEFLSDAIDSVLKQTFSDFELLVLDNCSTDCTRELVAAYTARDARVRYFCNEANLGPQENLNRCLTKASGVYVKILCSDDLLAPDALEKSLAALDDNPSVTLVAFARIMVSRSLEPGRTEAFKIRQGIVRGNSVVMECLFRGNLIGEPAAVMFRKQDASRGFDTNFAQLIDLEMWMFLLSQGDLFYIPEVYCSIRQHEAQLTHSNVMFPERLSNELLLLKERYGSKLTGVHSFIWRFRYAYLVWTTGDISGGSLCEKSNLVNRQFPTALFILLFIPMLITINIRKMFRRLSCYLFIGSGYK